MIRQVCRWHVSGRRGGRVVFNLDQRDLGPLRYPLGQGPEEQNKNKIRINKKNQDKVKEITSCKYLLLFLVVGAEGGEVEIRLRCSRARSWRRRFPRALGGLRGCGL